MNQTIFKTIYLATDHAGFAFKEKVREYLQKNDAYKVVDCGAFAFKEGDDYPEYIMLAAEKISEGGPTVAGIVFGHSGQGEAIAAGKFPHIRSTVCYGGPEQLKIVSLGREHNDANVLSIGAGFVAEADLINVIEMWLTTPFSRDERHARRLAQLEKIESK